MKLNMQALLLAFGGVLAPTLAKYQRFELPPSYAPGEAHSRRNTHRSKYNPHQGPRECARRKRRLTNG